ncbi:hypothetical protein OIV83_002073 [Microbotryomycetes sp. JL201]|nr:hypothetical protein OIV83_002073 [Microbotryomycetes sp. JL201]
MSRGHVPRPYGSTEQATEHHGRVRSLVFRQLGAVAHLAGSQFAMLWINPAGESEIVASEALFGHLGHMFGPEVIASAKQATTASHSRTYAGADEHTIRLIKGSIYGPTGEVVHSCETPEDIASNYRSTSPKRPTSPEHSEHYTNAMRLYAEPASHRPISQLSEPRERHPSADSSMTEPRTPKRPNAPQLTSPTSTSSSVRSSVAAHGTRSRKSLSLELGIGPLLDGSAEVEPLTLSPQTIGEWFNKRLEILPQAVSKTVAKLWVKVIDPEKQNLYPYNRGDAGAPPWWPRSIRHKEPDHLYKAERITLLSALIRCTRKPIQEFEDVLGRRLSQIPDAHMPVLADIIKVAREERRVSEASPDGTFQYITVLVSPQSAALASQLGKPTESDAQTTGLVRSSSLRSISDLAPRARSTQPYALARSPSVQEGAFANASMIPTSKGLSRSQSMTSRAGREKTPTSSHRRKRLSLGGVSEITELDNRLQAVTDLQSPTEASAPSPSKVRKNLPRTVVSSPAPDRPAHAFPSVLEPAFASPAMIRSRSQLAAMSQGQDHLKPIDETFDEYGRRIEPTLRRQTATIGAKSAGGIALKAYSPYSLGSQPSVPGPVIHPMSKSALSGPPLGQDEPAPSMDHQASYRALSATYAPPAAQPSPVLYHDPTFTSSYTSVRELSPAFGSRNLSSEQYCLPASQVQNSISYWTPESLDGSLPTLSPVPDAPLEVGGLPAYKHQSESTATAYDLPSHHSMMSIHGYTSLSGFPSTNRPDDVWDSPFYGTESGVPSSHDHRSVVPTVSDQWVYGRSVSGSYM